MMKMMRMMKLFFVDGHGVADNADKTRPKQTKQQQKMRMMKKKKEKL